MLSITDARSSDLPDFSLFDCIVVGAGFAGSVIARELAERSGKRVAVIEQRGHIGGNAYDELDENGVLVHRYGPHIFHTGSQRVYEYLSRYTEWYDYAHEVLADIHGAYTPVPFNLNSIEQHFDGHKAAALIDRLVERFGMNTKVPIIELRAQKDPLLSELADFVYQNVFLYYTQKQWGLAPEEVDPTVTARVPVLVGRDNRYFQDAYQGMPRAGYTPLFERLLDYPGIEVFVNLDAAEVLEFVAPDAGSDTPFAQTRASGAAFVGEVVYTGPLDFLCKKRFGLLPYRSLEFVYEPHDCKHVLPCGTVNYTVSEDYTRITEYTWLTGQDISHTTLMKEYPLAFEDKPGQVPYYAILDDKNRQHYERYLGLFASLPNFHALGRLAEYRYFNMDQIVERALELADSLCVG
ncbi:MAG: UDP-galactopyranose mutase [Coriobacteriales bacterium]|jgi:UDP-galactopyranose mutase|nr:UDP-galactopyranose mutase [Coriobacteriales bacterium]